jgi:hypothetical protein
MGSAHHDAAALAAKHLLTLGLNPGSANPLGGLRRSTDALCELLNRARRGAQVSVKFFR